jgi:hypothetical protein
MNIRLRGFLFLALVTLLFWLGCRPKPTIPRGPLPDGDYRLIANRSNNGCLDIRGDNKRMQIFGCGGGENQKFVFKADASNYYTITSPSLAGRCLDVNEHNNNPDQLLQMYFCEPTNYQKWEVIRTGDWYQLKNAVSQQCMRVRDTSGGNETWVVQDGCNDGERRDLWRIERLGGAPPPSPTPNPSPQPSPTPVATSQIIDASGPCTPVQGFGYSNCVLKVKNKSNQAIVATFQWTGIGIPPNVNGKLEKKNMLVGAGATITIQTSPFANPANPARTFLCTAAHYQ